MANRISNQSVFTKSLRGVAIPLLIAVGVLLGGCATSTPPLSYYLLHDTSTNRITTTSPDAVVLIDKVVLPDYLKQRGLVFQTSETGIHISTDHLWAEPMDEGFTKSLRDSLTEHNIELITHAMGEQEPDAYLSLRIDDFIASHQGDIVLRGEYFLSYANERNARARFHLTFPLQQDGFEESVKVMREAIATLADRMTTGLSDK